MHPIGGAWLLFLLSYYQATLEIARAANVLDANTKAPTPPPPYPKKEDISCGWLVNSPQSPNPLFLKSCSENMRGVLTYWWGQCEDGPGAWSNVPKYGYTWWSWPKTPWLHRTALMDPWYSGDNAKSDDYDRYNNTHYFRPYYRCVPLIPPTLLRPLTTGAGQV
jgi:hypothetical protein